MCPAQGRGRRWSCPGEGKEVVLPRGGERWSCPGEGEVVLPGGGGGPAQGEGGGGPAQGEVVLPRGGGQVLGPPLGPGQGYPPHPWQYMPRTGYSAGGMPFVFQLSCYHFLAVSLISSYQWRVSAYHQISSFIIIIT